MNLTDSTKAELNNLGLVAVPKAQMDELLQMLDSSRAREADAILVIKHFSGMIPMGPDGKMDMGALMNKMMGAMGGGLAIPADVAAAMERIKAYTT